MEGKTLVLVPRLEAFVNSPSEYAPSKSPVFYNPIMEFNRDIAVLALQSYQRIVGRDVSVCEPLAGCGIRGTRFAVEVENTKKVLMNDINERAVLIAKHNVRSNRLEKTVSVRNQDANVLLSNHGAPHRRFDFIDLDPFGSPVPYADSAIRAMRNNGMVALTATDMAPLCGVHPKACVRKYGGKPLRTEYCHELAIRLLTGCLATIAAKHEMGIEAMFSHNADHYIRLYAKVACGARIADQSLENMGYIFHCFKCFHREIVSGSAPFGHCGKCAECGSRLSVAGPLWLGRLFDSRFCELMEEENKKRELSQGRRIAKMLALAKNEANAPATYYVSDKLSDSLTLPVPPMKSLLAILGRNGFKAGLTSLNSRGIRTDAPARKIKQLLREASHMDLGEKICNKP